MIPFLLDLYQSLLARDGAAADPGPLRVFQYISVRAGSALVFAFVISLALGPRVIGRLRRLRVGQIIRRARREDAISLHDMHGAKEGTPTMGGLLIMASLFVSVLTFARLQVSVVPLLLLLCLGFGLLGFVDDYAKLARQNHLGLSPRGKIVLQLALGFALALVLYVDRDAVRYTVTGDTGYSRLLVPFFKSFYPALGLLFIPWVMFIMAAATNAVNLTDGLDGLAIGTTGVCALTFTIVAYLTSRADTAAYLHLPHVPAGSEVTVFGAALVGSCLGFLWFNAHPAEIFMGDTGSMLLGGALGSMALILKQEALLAIVGGVFVIEALSVIIQVMSYKTTGRRVFLMSPIHHHFEKKGMHENKIILRFWTVSVLLALAGLATLKIR